MANPVVVLIHGLGRTPRSFGRTPAVYEAAGFSVRRFGYRSRHGTLADHVAAAVEVLRLLPGACVVGHSLGGIVGAEALSLLAAEGWPVGGLVTLGTPWQGAAAARFSLRLAPLRWLLGPVLHDLARDRAPRPPAYCDKAMSIAGGTGSARGFNPFFGRDNDGLVAVAETLAPGCAAGFLRCPHTTLPASRPAARMAAEFLAGACRGAAVSRSSADPCSPQDP